MMVASFRIRKEVSEAGSAYAPNLAVALCACFGVGDAEGKLPVDLPALNERCQMTDEILYSRG